MVLFELDLDPCVQLKIRKNFQIIISTTGNQTLIHYTQVCRIIYTQAMIFRRSFLLSL